MSTEVDDILSKLRSLLKAMAIFKAVDTVEPKGAPGTGLTVAVYLHTIAPAVEASGLSSISGVYVYNIRIYTNMLQEPTEDIDTILAKAVDKVFVALGADFDLGTKVKNIDIFGEHGTALIAKAGYVEVAHVMYRIVDITLPLVVNDTWPLS